MELCRDGADDTVSLSWTTSRPSARASDTPRNSNIYVHEGPRALFKGLGPTLIGVVPARAINFSTYAQSKQFLAASLPHNVTLSSTSAAEASPVVHLGAAAIAGIMTATATNPIWVIKTRLQLEAKHQERILANGTSTRAAAAAAAAAAPGKKSIGMLPAFTMTKDILAKEGLKGLYKGMSASYLGVTEGVIQWVLYEVRLPRMRPPPRPHTHLPPLGSA